MKAAEWWKMAVRLVRICQEERDQAHKSKCEQPEETYPGRFRAVTAAIKKLTFTVNQLLHRVTIIKVTCRDKFM